VEPVGRLSGAADAFVCIPTFGHERGQGHVHVAACLQLLLFVSWQSCSALQVRRQLVSFHCLKLTATQIINAKYTKRLVKYITYFSWT
jgi:hypothetical protein